MLAARVLYFSLTARRRKVLTPAHFNRTAGNIVTGSANYDVLEIEKTFFLTFLSLYSTAKYNQDCNKCFT